jgi:hypothetical protein
MAGDPGSMELVWPKRWGSQQGMDPARPTDGGPGGVWIWHMVRAWHSQRGKDPGVGGAWIWHSLSGGEPSGAEQRLCRPMGWGLGRPAVLSLDCGIEKPSMI